LENPFPKEHSGYAIQLDTLFSFMSLYIKFASFIIIILKIKKKMFDAYKIFIKSTNGLMFFLENNVWKNILEF